MPVTGLPISTDIHSHILPGIDDGAPDVETAVELVRGLYNLGIRHTVATPHIIGDLYRNNASTIKAALLVLQDACAAAQINISIAAAAEYMLDDYFTKLLRSGEPMLTVHKKYLLTEQSYASPSPNLHETAFEIISEGYKPIMAHPERYHFYHGKFDNYSILKDMGFDLQVNLLSLTGYYGKPVAKAAKYILDNNLADFVATDLHHHRHLDALKRPSHLALFQQYAGQQAFNQFDRL